MRHAVAIAQAESYHSGRYQILPPGGVEALGAFTPIGAQWVNAPRQQAIIIYPHVPSCVIWYSAFRYAREKRLRS